MVKLHIRHLVVRNKDAALIGIISKWDITELYRNKAFLTLSSVKMKDLPPDEDLQKLITVKPMDTILAALKTMNKVAWPKGCPRPAGATTYRIRSLPVITNTGLQGMVTQGDFLKCFLHNIPTTEPVSKIMTRRLDLISVDENETVARCSNLMSHHGIRHILINKSEVLLMKPMCIGKPAPPPAPGTPVPDVNAGKVAIGTGQFCYKAMCFGATFLTDMEWAEELCSDI